MADFLEGHPYPDLSDLNAAEALRDLANQVEALQADAERLEFMVSRGYYIGWNRDGEACRVFGIYDEETGFEPISGSKYFYSAREAIDEARSAK